MFSLKVEVKLPPNFKHASFKLESHMHLQNINMQLLILERVLSLICAAARHSSSQHLIALCVLIKNCIVFFDKEMPSPWMILLISLRSGLFLQTAKMTAVFVSLFFCVLVGYLENIFTHVKWTSKHTYVLSQVCRRICVEDYSESLSKQAVSLLLSLCSGHHGNISLLRGGTDLTLNFHWHHSLAGSPEWFLNWNSSQ